MSEETKPKINHIERQAVTSSNVKSVGFCPDTKRIHVEFGSGIYAYDDCTQEHFDALMKADATPNQSVGGYVHANLKQKKFHKLT